MNAEDAVFLMELAIRPDDDVVTPTPRVLSAGRTLNYDQMKAFQEPRDIFEDFNR